MLDIRLKTCTYKAFGTKATGRAQTLVGKGEKNGMNRS